MASALLFWAGGAAAETNNPVVSPPEAKNLSRVLPALWFPVGESLTYKVYWGVIPVGYCRATINWIEKDGRPQLHIRALGKSNKVVETLYPIEEIVEAVVDPVAFQSWFNWRWSSEGGKKGLQRTTFHRAERRLVWEDLLKDKRKELDFDPQATDLPALIYLLRREGLRPDEERAYNVYADEVPYELRLKTERVEQVSLSAYGSVEAVKLEPTGLKKNTGEMYRKGRLWLWVSTDPRHIPVRAVIRVPVASVSMVLIDVAGPGDDFWITRKKASAYDEGAEKLLSGIKNPKEML
jgi:hypothetical protein